MNEGTGPYTCNLHGNDMCQISNASTTAYQLSLTSVPLHVPQHVVVPYKLTLSQTKSKIAKILNIRVKF